ncbi:hypothetical protein HZS_4912 [Henneguya salminicola]|nr:hypothetical protein HZS_4912 [Henneguya salminicola]
MYASLYFAVFIDNNESELGTIDLIQVFVQTIDKCFANITECEFVEKFEQIYYILDEIIINGIVHETSPTEIYKNFVAQMEAARNVVLIHFIYIHTGIKDAAEDTMKKISSINIKETISKGIEKLAEKFL